VKEDCRGERRPAWLMREAARHRPPPLGSRPSLNGVGLGVKVEGPRGVVIVAMRGSDGGVVAGATTATATKGSTVVVPSSLAP
jgi:coenzyme F420-reducing hydrogenase alpha subunit